MSVHDNLGLYVFSIDIGLKESMHTDTSKEKVMNGHIKG
jgi:hypothetical protein